MTFSKNIKIISFLAIISLLIFAPIYVFQRFKVENRGELIRDFEANIEEAEKLKTIQLDSARKCAYQAYNLVKDEPLEFQKKSSILLLSEIKFLQFGASDRLFKKVEKCEKWFHERKFYEKSFEASLLKLKIKSFQKGDEAVWNETDELIGLAKSIKNDKFLAEAYYFKMQKRDYSRKWEDDVHLLDSARILAYKLKDSMLLAKIRITSSLPVNGSQASIDSTSRSLKEAIKWNSPELKCLSYQSLALEQMSNVKLLDSSIHCLDNGIEAAQQWGSDPYRLYMRRDQVTTYMYAAETDIAIKIGRDAIELARKVGNKPKEIALLRHLAAAHRSKKEPSKGIDLAQKALSVSQAIGDEKSEFTSKDILAQFMISANRFQEAEVLANEMFKWVNGRESTIVNKIFKSKVIHIKGEIKEVQSELDSAIHFYKLAAEIMKDHSGHNRMLPDLNILNVLLKQEKYAEAKDQYDYLTSIYSNYFLWHPNFLFLKGKLMFHLDRKSEAIDALQEFLLKYKSSRKNHSFLARNMLSKLYEVQGKYELALENKKEAFRLKLEISEEKDELKLEKLQSKYELSEKKKEIQKLEIERLEQKNDLEANKNTLQTRRIYIIFLSILLVLLLAIFVSVSRRAKDAIVKKDLQRTALEKERQIERLKAEESQRSIDTKNQFFANISHEFRTPLTLINAPVEALIEKVDDNIKKPLEIVKRNADHLLVMVDEILELSRLDSGNTSLSKKSFGLNSFIRNLQMNFEPIFRQNNIDFNIDLPNDTYTILGDEYRLKMVMNNLLNNAFHHTPKQGVITLEVEVNKENGELELRVFNSGDWIDEAFLPSIFDRYTRSKEKEYSGYGIGLSFCKKVILLHEGTISAENVENGVLLVLSFPTTFEKREPKLMISEEVEYWFDSDSEEDLYRENTLLIVEDNSEVQRLLSDILSSQYEVIVANNGEEGIIKAKEDQPDLIISDVMMPKVGGMELASTLKDNFSTSHIPIILLTAKSTSYDRISGLETGADDYLTKPFSPKELRVRVKNLIQQRKKLQKRFSKNIFLMPEEITSNSLDQEFLLKASEIVEENLLNSEFNVEEFCRKLALNRNSVHQKLKLLTAMNSSQFIKSIKLKTAATLLADERIPIIEVSELSGFNNRQAFYKAFKEQFEVTPSVYRKNCLGKNN